MSVSVARPQWCHLCNKPECHVTTEKCNHYLAKEGKPMLATAALDLNNPQQFGMFVRRIWEQLSANTVSAGTAYKPGYQLVSREDVFMACVKGKRP